VSCLTALFMNTALWTTEQTVFIVERFCRKETAIRA